MSKATTKLVQLTFAKQTYGNNRVHTKDADYLSLIHYLLPDYWRMIIFLGSVPPKTDEWVTELSF